MRKSCWRWLRCAKRAINVQVRKSELIQAKGMKKGRERPKIA